MQQYDQQFQHLQESQKEFELLSWNQRMMQLDKLCWQLDKEQGTVQPMETSQKLDQLGREMHQQLVATPLHTSDVSVYFVLLLELTLCNVCFFIIT